MPSGLPSPSTTVIRFPEVPNDASASCSTCSSTWVRTVSRTCPSSRLASPPGQAMNRPPSGAGSLSRSSQKDQTRRSSKSTSRTRSSEPSPSEAQTPGVDPVDPQAGVTRHVHSSRPARGVSQGTPRHPPVGARGASQHSRGSESRDPGRDVAGEQVGQVAVGHGAGRLHLGAARPDCRRRGAAATTSRPPSGRAQPSFSATASTASSRRPAGGREQGERPADEEGEEQEEPVALEEVDLVRVAGELVAVQRRRRRGRRRTRQPRCQQRRLSSVSSQ